MYNEAQGVLGKGLSPFTRVLLGGVAVVFGIVMLLIAPGMEKPIGIAAFGIFCLIIAVMCMVTGKLRNYLGRFVGALIFVCAVFYLADEISGGEFVSGRRSEPSILNAVAFFIAFGIPGAWFAIKGRLPLKPHE